MTRKVPGAFAPIAQKSLFLCVIFEQMMAQKALLILHVFTSRKQERIQLELGEMVFIYNALFGNRSLGVSHYQRFLIGWMKTENLLV